MELAQILLLITVLGPGIVAGLLGLVWLLGWTPPERFITRTTGGIFAAAAMAIAALAWKLALSDAPKVVLSFGNWFAVGDYHFPLVLMADRLSLPFLGLTVVLAGLIGQFSSTYLHRESGFLRFFLPAASVRLRIGAGLRGGVVRPAGGRMGTGGHQFGGADRILPTA
jgi:NADH:ubiquinone oxidoreductase subunit 5 (subunit L)/multisubunit Na+/H+ antiporter MnhA subunit